MSVSPLGIDRVVDFCFGSGDAAYHLILELYASGNVVLTDANYNVLTLLRSHKDAANSELSLFANRQYPLERCRAWARTDPSLLQMLAQQPSEQNTIKGSKAKDVLNQVPACFADAGILVSFRTLFQS